MRYPELTFMSLVSVFIAITIHEFAHAKTADVQGDSTPRMMGRVTLNPAKHFDPFGVIMIVVTSLTGYGIGWGKPVMTNPRNFKNPRWDQMWVALAGPLSNFLQAAVAAILLRLISPGSMQIDQITPPSFLLVFSLTNIMLMLFNLIPLGPLDGHWIVGAFLPDGVRHQWFQWNRITGSFVLLGLIIMSQVSGFNFIGNLLMKPAEIIITFLLGR